MHIFKQNLSRTKKPSQMECRGQGKGVMDLVNIRGRQGRGCRRWSVLAPISEGFFCQFLLADMTNDLHWSGFHCTKWPCNCKSQKWLLQNMIKVWAGLNTFWFFLEGDRVGWGGTVPWCAFWLTEIASIPLVVAPFH